MNQEPVAVSAPAKTKYKKSARTAEGRVKERIEKLLRMYGVYYRMPVTGGFGHSGQLDFYGCYRGKFIGVEAKAEHGVISMLQQKEIEAIRAANGFACVVRGDHGLNELIDFLDGERLV
jgi:hypothetical protein